MGGESGTRPQTEDDKLTIGQLLNGMKPGERIVYGDKQITYIGEYQYRVETR